MTLAKDAATILRPSCACGRPLRPVNRTGVCGTCQNVTPGRRPPKYQHTCTECGAAFAHSQPHAKVCSTACGRTRENRMRAEAARAKANAPRCQVCGQPVPAGKRTLCGSAACKRQQGAARMRKHYRQASVAHDVGLRFSEIEHVETKTADLESGCCRECKAYGRDRIGQQNHYRYCSQHADNRVWVA
jgi:hypothetical protein